MELFTKQPNLNTRWITFENRAGEKGRAAMENRGAKGHPMESLKAGETKTLLDAHGSGTIRRIWLTLRPRDPRTLRSVRIEMFWDGAATPAVSAPLGDFFGAPLGRAVPLQNEFFSNPEGRSFNCTIPMPFHKSARVAVTNDSDTDISHLFYEIDCTLGDAHGDDMLYFHSVWHRVPVTTLGKDFEILPKVEGEGRFLGTNISVMLSPENRGWWGEGEVKVYLDGDGEFPTLAGTGTEDYIGTGWGQGLYQHRYQGSVISDKDNRQYGFYRFHVPDPVYFHKDCRVTIQQMGGAEKPVVLKLLEKGAPIQPVAIDSGGGGKYTKLLEQSPAPKLTDEGVPNGWVNHYRQDDWCAVAYFYLDSPENKLAPIQKLEERIAGLKGEKPADNEA